MVISFIQYFPFTCQSCFFPCLSTNYTHAWYHQHANTLLSLSNPAVSLWSSIRGCDLAGAPCINNRMNITMLSLNSVQWHSRLGESRNVALLLCLSCKLAVFTIGYWVDQLKHLRQVHVTSNIITRESQPSAVFPCLVVVNLSGIHSNTAEFSASN